MSARRGEEYVINSALLHPAFFLTGNRAKSGVANVVAVKNLFTLATCFQVFHGIRICDRSALSLANCFEKIVMATKNSRSNSNYMFACK